MKAQDTTMPAERAFSLVELSIVLVILGLLVGGVLSGQSLIRAAEIRSIGVDYNRFVTATYTFRDKYFYLPGDMPNATQVWGAQNATPATCQVTASTTALTCNGDGDGSLQYQSNTVVFEMHRYWQHLANAALIEGKFTGVGTNNPTSQDGSTPGVNSPKLRVGNSVFQARFAGTSTGQTDVYDGNYGNVYYFGIAQGNYNPHNPIISTQEAWNIDTKFDDGKPALGRIRTFKHGSLDSWAVNSNQCSDSATQSTANYALSLSGILCSLMFTWQN